MLLRLGTDIAIAIDTDNRLVIQILSLLILILLLLPVILILLWLMLLLLCRSTMLVIRPKVLGMFFAPINDNSSTIIAIARNNAALTTTDRI